MKNAEANWICNKISELLQIQHHDEIEGEISLNNMVIIARNRFVFLPLEEFLNTNKIPYTLKKGERQAEPSSTLGKVFDLSIRLRLNPKDWVDGKKLCSTLKIKLPIKWGTENLLQYFADETQTSDIPFPEIQVNLLNAIQILDLDLPNIPKLCSEFESLINNIRSNCSVEENGEIERTLQDIQDIRRYWTTFKRKGLGTSLLSFRNAMALGQLSDDGGSSGLTLSTVHTMKGLEKDIVFLMGMCEGVFPDYRANTVKEIEEERNNAFVAVTRSRRWIYITYPQQRKMPWGAIKVQTPSRFVRQMQS